MHEHEHYFLKEVHISHVAIGAVTLLGMGIYLFFTIYSTQEVVTTGALIPVVTPTPPLPIMHDTLASSTPALRILFVGDMFFDRQIRFVSSLYGPDYPFSCADSLLSSADMVVGNMEGPITTNESISLGTLPGSVNNYRFTFPTTTATTLARHNIRAVTLGNNHILNFGYSGLTATHAYLDKAQMGYFGGVAGSEPVYRIDQPGLHLSFVGYNEFGGSTPEDVALTIAAEHVQGRVVVVFSHWGTEYSTNADAIRPWARLFASSGASAIIGSHPHIVGQKERIGNTVVYYSLGNFIFDQYFSDAVRHGLAVMLTVTPEGVTQVEEYKTELERDGRTCIVDN